MALAKKMKTKTRSQVKSFDQKHYGDEPVFKGTPTNSQFSDAFNWYNYMYDVSKGKQWLLEYLKKDNRSPQLIREIRNAPDWRTSGTQCWIARMMLNGTTIPEQMMERFNERLRENALYGIKSDAPAVKTNVISIQDRVKRAIDNLLADAEVEVIDERKSMYEFLQARQASSAAAKRMIDYYQPILDEVMSDDEQVKEAFGKNLKSERAFMQSVLDDLNRYVGNKKAVKIRKPREKKVKTAVDQVKNLKFQKEFPPLKIVSVNPAEVVGCSQLWTYNTKYKKLTRYDSVGPAGIQVKGTTLIGYDAETSLTKSVRKPEVTIQNILSAGKVALRTILSDLKTNESKPNGRINSDTILLRVVK